MTIAELKKRIEDLPDDMRVHYKYDSGYSYPELVDGYVCRIPDSDMQDGVFMLDESPRVPGEEPDWSADAAKPE